MSRLPVVGGDSDVWGQVLNDFLAVAHNPDGSLSQSAVTGAGAAADASVVHLSGDENIAGTKTFASSPQVPAPTAGGQAANKTYVDATVSAGAPDASSSTKGLVQLTGDLGGTATAPTVPGLAGKVASVTATDATITISGTATAPTVGVNSIPESKVTNLTSDLGNKVSTSRQVISGTGLSGGGDLTADRTLSVTYGTTAGTATQGNDSRVAGAEQTTNKGLASGYAGLNNFSQVNTANLPPTSLGIFFNRTAGANAEIYCMMSDGSNVRQLTNDASFHSWWPKVSPDGSRILFLRAPLSLTNYDSDFTQQSLWVANIDGSNPTQILAQGWAGGSSYLGTPNWHPNGRDIIFFGGGGIAAIYLVKAEGGTPVNIPVTGATTGFADTSISPDGNNILFGFNNNIFMVPITGGAAFQLTSDGGSTLNTDPYFNSDNQTIAFLTNFAPPDGTHFGGQWGIRTIKRDGTGLTTIINDGNINSKPAWGEDGYIYFHRFYYGSPPGTGGDANWSLAKIRADGSGSVIRLTSGAIRDYMPDAHIARIPRTPSIHGNNHLAGGSDAIPWLVVHSAGLQSGLPAASASNAGYTYFAADVTVLYQSNGSSWFPLAAPIIGTPIIFSRSGSTVTAVNTVTETPLINVAITGAVASNIFRFQASGDYLNNSGSTVNFRWRIYLGATLLLDTANIPITTNASRSQWILDGYLYVDSTSIQRLAANFFLSPQNSVSWVPFGAHMTGGADATVDMTTNPNLIFSVTMDTAVATADAHLKVYFIERFL